jgi:anti-sigma-K factor RskA
MLMASKDLKFLIAQYLDGTLSAHQRAQIEQRLTEDPALQQFVQEELRLDGLLGAAAPPPVVDWEELELRISAAVAEARDPQDRRRPSIEWLGAWLGTWVRVAALAACVLIVAGIALLPHRAAAPLVAVPDAGSAVVIGPQAEPPSIGPQFAQVTLASPSPIDLYLAALDASDRPSHVSISSATLH